MTRHRYPTTARPDWGPMTIYRSMLSALALAITSSAAYPAAPGDKVATIDLRKATLDRRNVEASRVRYRGADALMLRAAPNVADDATFAAIRGVTARDFVIEADLSGVPVGDTTTAREFVGIAFRISDDRDRFEAIYLRPTNARADDQVRRNHTTQYISHPGSPWERLRAAHPGKYESYVDLDAERWTRIRLVVDGSRAELYVSDATQPALIVNDLKLPPASGGIGLWVGPGSKGYFKSVTVAVRQP